MGYFVRFYFAFVGGCIECFCTIEVGWPS